MNELNDELRQDFHDADYAHAYVDDFLSAEIATQIKVLREQRELTQQQLAELAGMSQPRLSKLEDVNYGSWNIKTLAKLARAFDVTLKVSFETFGSRIGDIVNFNRRALQRKSRADEFASAESAPLGGSGIVNMFEWQKKRNQPPQFRKSQEPEAPPPPEQKPQQEMRWLKPRHPLTNRRSTLPVDLCPEAASLPLPSPILSVGE